MEIKPQGKGPHPCVFCGLMKKLTGEHIWSDWLKKILPNDRVNDTWFQTGMLIANDHEKRISFAIPDLSPTRRGRPHKMKIRNVCGDCNGGWMSRIVNKAKPAAEGLILNSARTVDTSDQQKLAAWITLTAIMAEYSKPLHQVIPEADRTRLMVTGTPSANMTICIARYGGATGSKWWPNAYRHHAGTSMNNTSQNVQDFRPEQFIDRPKFDTQITLYTILGLVIIAFSSEVNSKVDFFRRFCVPDGFFTIFPGSGRSLDWSAVGTFDDADLNRFSDLRMLAHGLEKLRKEQGPRTTESG